MFRKQILIPIIVLSVLLGCATKNEIVQEEIKPYDPLDTLVGVWEGSYTGANQGETGLTLDVYKENGKYAAVFHYYNLPGKNNVNEGKYYMDVTYNENKGAYFLKASEWIIHPNNYTSGDLEGSITGNIFSGSLLVNNYTSGIRFSVVRQ
jgi:hypothetical protein